MNVFPSGETKTARCVIPASPAGIESTAELYLTKDGVYKDASSGVKSFVSAGPQTELALQVTMPEGGYWYDVFIDADVGGVPSHYKGGEQVAVPAVGEPTIIWQ